MSAIDNHNTGAPMPGELKDFVMLNGLLGDKDKIELEAQNESGTVWIVRSGGVEYEYRTAGAAASGDVGGKFTRFDNFSSKAKQTGSWSELFDVSLERAYEANRCIVYGKPTYDRPPIADVFRRLGNMGLFNKLYERYEGTPYTVKISPMGTVFAENQEKNCVYEIALKFPYTYRGAEEYFLNRFYFDHNFKLVSPKLQEKYYNKAVEIGEDKKALTEEEIRKQNIPTVNNGIFNQTDIQAMILQVVAKMADGSGIQNYLVGDAKKLLAEKNSEYQRDATLANCSVDSYHLRCGKPIFRYVAKYYGFVDDPYQFGISVKSETSEKRYRFNCDVDKNGDITLLCPQCGQELVRDGSVVKNSALSPSLMFDCEAGCGLGCSKCVVHRCADANCRNTWSSISKSRKPGSIAGVPLGRSAQYCSEHLVKCQGEDCGNLVYVNDRDKYHRCSVPGCGEVYCETCWSAMTPAKRAGLLRTCATCGNQFCVTHATDFKTCVSCGVVECGKCAAKSMIPSDSDKGGFIHNTDACMTVCKGTLKRVAKKGQSKKCNCCGETYSVDYFEGDSDLCKLCAPILLQTPTEDCIRKGELHRDKLDPVKRDKTVLANENLFLVMIASKGKVYRFDKIANQGKAVMKLEQVGSITDGVFVPKVRRVGGDL